MPDTGVESNDITHFTVTAGNGRRMLSGMMRGTHIENIQTVPQLTPGGTVDTMSVPHIDITSSSSSSIKLTYTVQFYNPSYSFQQVSSMLAKSVKDCTFDAILSSEAAYYGASALSDVTSSSIKVQNLFPNSNKSSLSSGGIAGIVVAGIFVLVFSVSLVYWFVVLEKPPKMVQDFTSIFSVGNTTKTKEGETKDGDPEKGEGKESSENKESVKETPKEILAKEKSSKKQEKAPVSKKQDDSNDADSDDDNAEVHMDKAHSKKKEDLNPSESKKGKRFNSVLAKRDSEVVTTENIYRSRLKMMGKKPSTDGPSSSSTATPKKKTRENEFVEGEGIMMEMTSMSSSKKDKEKDKESAKLERVSSSTRGESESGRTERLSSKAAYANAAARARQRSERSRPAPSNRRSQHDSDEEDFAL